MVTVQQRCNLEVWKNNHHSVKHRVVYSDTFLLYTRFLKEYMYNFSPSKMTSTAESQFEPNSTRFAEFLSRLKIAMVKIEDWVVLQRSRFDITMDDEPFTALQLYLNTQTRSYITRVWGKTHSKGTITGSVAELELLCNQIFAQGMTCCPGTSGKGATDSMVSVDYPFKRMVSQYPRISGWTHKYLICVQVSWF